MRFVRRRLIGAFHEPRWEIKKTSHRSPGAVDWLPRRFLGLHFYEIYRRRWLFLWRLNRLSRVEAFPSLRANLTVILGQKRSKNRSISAEKSTPNDEHRIEKPFDKRAEKCFVLVPVFSRKWLADLNWWRVSIVWLDSFGPHYTLRDF